MKTVKIIVTGLLLVLCAAALLGCGANEVVLQRENFAEKGYFVSEEPNSQQDEKDSEKSGLITVLRAERLDAVSATASRVEVYYYKNNGAAAKAKPYLEIRVSDGDKLEIRGNKIYLGSEAAIGDAL